jgi:hypothetical protein
MIDWTSILTNVGSFTAFSGIIAWVVKSIAKSYVDKDLEHYKSELNLTYLKSQRIYDERLKTLKKLYDKLVSVQFAMKELTAILKYVKEDPETDEKERIQKAGEAYNEFFLFYSKNKILFPPQTCETIDSLIKQYFSSLTTHSINFRYKFSDVDKEIEVYDNVNKEIPKILDKLEVDFRELLEGKSKQLKS